MNRSTSIFPPAIATNLRDPAPGRTRALLAAAYSRGPSISSSAWSKL